MKIILTSGLCLTIIGLSAQPIYAHDKDNHRHCNLRQNNQIYKCSPRHNLTQSLHHLQLSATQRRQVQKILAKNTNRSLHHKLRLLNRKLLLLDLQSTSNTQNERTKIISEETSLITQLAQQESTISSSIARILTTDQKAKLTEIIKTNPVHQPHKLHVLPEKQ